MGSSKKRFVLMLVIACQIAGLFSFHLPETGFISVSASSTHQMTLSPKKTETMESASVVLDNNQIERNFGSRVMLSKNSVPGKNYVFSHTICTWEEMQGNVFSCIYFLIVLLCLLFISFRQNQLTILHNKDGKKRQYTFIAAIN